jgi:hypothetical protein
MAPPGLQREKFFASFFIVPKARFQHDKEALPSLAPPATNWSPNSATAQTPFPAAGTAASPTTPHHG